METMILSLGLIMLSIVGLGIGVILGRPPIKGSCGGLSCIKGTDCAGCKRRHSQDVRS